MKNEHKDKRVEKLVNEIKENYPTDKAIAEGYNWLEQHGERVYSAKGVSYTTDSIIKALRITAQHKSTEWVYPMADAIFETEKPEQSTNL